jgi:hypothetical protein
MINPATPCVQQHDVFQVHVRFVGGFGVTAILFIMCPQAQYFYVFFLLIKLYTIVCCLLILREYELSVGGSNFS